MNKNVLLKLLLCLLIVCMVAFCFTGCDFSAIMNNANSGNNENNSQTDNNDDDDGADDSSLEQDGFSKGFEYCFNSARDGYIIVGIGTNSDKVIKIPETYKGLPVTGIEFENEDYDDDYVEKIVLSKNIKVDDLGRIFRSFSRLAEIEVDSKNPYAKSVNGILYSQNGKSLICVPEACDITEFLIPEGVEIITWESISSNISTITLPKSLKAVSGWAMLYGKNIKYAGTIQELMDSELEVVGFTIECVDGIYQP